MDLFQSEQMVIALLLRERPASTALRDLIFPLMMSV